MLSVEDARAILGPECPLTDPELTKLLEALRTVATFSVDAWLREREGSGHVTTGDHLELDQTAQHVPAGDPPPKPDGGPCRRSGTRYSGLRRRKANRRQVSGAR